MTTIVGYLRTFFFALACLVSSLPLLAGSVAHAEEETDPAQELHVELVGTGAFTSGDTAQFQQRQRMPEDASGGIGALHYGTEIADGTNLTIDGHALFGDRDYLVGINIDNPDKGFFHVGFRQFRTWYDASGGYFPPSNGYFRLYDPKLGLDRGEAWAQGGLTLPADFKLTLGYRYLFRNGSKSSIEWGDSSALGLPSPNNRRMIVPAFYEIDEDRHQIDAAVTRETTDTVLGTALHYETSKIDDRRNATRTPGQAGSERTLTQRDNSDGDVFGARAFGSHHMFGDKLVLSGAYAYNDIDLDLGGSRIYGPVFNSSYNPFSPNRQQRDEGFLDLAGSTKMREHVGNLAAAARPAENVSLLTSVRIRGENINGNANFVETNVGGSPDFVTTLEDLGARNDTDDLSYAESIEGRYTGVTNLVLYTRGQWEQNNGNLNEVEFDPTAPAPDIERKSDIERRSQKYSAGVKYYPTHWLNLATEYAYKLNAYDYRHHVDSTSNDSVPPSSNRYPAYLEAQDFATHDFSLRATFRLPSNVTLVGRYDWLDTTIETRPDQLDRMESAEVRSHLFGGSASWNPATWWWVRSSLNYVLSETDTAVNNYTTPVATFLPSFDNNYLTANIGTGIALDTATDFELNYFFFSTSNYHDTSAFTQPYGSKSEENGVRARVVRRLNEHTKISVGYGYFVNDEAFAGGNYDYNVHLVTTSFEYDY